MLQLLTVPVAAALLLVCNPAPRDDKPKAVTLAEAVREFNQRAQNDATGKTQPPLTEDEAVAAIRGWIRRQVSATDDVYRVYQTIADTKKLPEGATLTFTTGWSGFNGYEFDVWWVDLNIKTGPSTGYTFRLRDQKLRCRPLRR
jgi:hypothetical protein